MNAENWDELYRKQGEIQKEVINLVKNSLQILKEMNVKNVLDVGFGTGRHVVFLAENGFDVHGIDVSERGKEITENKLNNKQLEADLKTADMHDLPYPDDSFDAIVAVHTIEHNTMEGLKKTISELKRVLKPNGILVTTLISRNDPRYGEGEELEPNTYIKIDDPAESGVEHHFSDKNEIDELFSGFRLIKIEEVEGFSTRRQIDCVHWEIVAEKNSYFHFITKNM
ncbi:MAG: methyltransferase domain-containing protein [Candidatus Aenigmatarchaeota archaeon]